MASIGATMAAHKVPLLLGGAGVAVVLGLRARKASASSSTSGAPIAGYTNGTTGTGGYDSSATDVYNALQPQLEQTQGMLGQLQTMLGSGIPTPAPVTVPVAPGPKTTPAPVVAAPAPRPRVLPTPAPVRKSSAPPRTYVVARGDSLSAIGARYGLSWNQLYAANRAAVGRDPNLIHPGLQLIIPGRVSMTVLQQIDAALASIGLNANARAGAEGNLQVESGFSPTASNPAEGAIGIAQWENGRRIALNSYAAAHGQSPTSIGAQLGFMLSEVQARGLVPKLNAAGSPAAGATLWDTAYEGSAGTTRAQRIADAQAIANGMPPSPAGAAGSTTASTQNASIVGDAVSGIWDTFKPIAYTGIFAVAGLALVVIGVTVTAAPKIKSATSEVAPIAAMAAV